MCRRANFSLKYGHAKSECARSKNSGFSLLEMLVTMLLGAILTSMAVSNLKKLNNPLQNGGAQLTSFLKEVKAQAISQTLAYTVAPSSTTHINTRYSATCNSATTTNDPTLTFDLPHTTHLTSTAWSVCFTSRGLVNTAQTIGVNDGATTKTITILLGGGIRIQ